MAFDIAGLGTIVVDHQVVLSRFPTVDTKCDVAEDRLQVGGPVPTALAVLSRFGKQCTFLGQWADDSWGRIIADDLCREGIGFEGSVERVGSRTGFAHVWIDAASGSRTIACRRSLDPLRADEVSKTLLDQCGALHLDGWPADAALKAAEIMKQLGRPVFLDTGSAKPGMDELIQLVDVLNCPRHFVTQRFGDDDVDRVARSLLEMGPRMVTITNGAGGAMLYTREGQREQSAYSIEAVDTTGAGDVFCGSLIYAVLEGWANDQILRFATASAALKCQKLGNRDAIPSVEDVIAFIEQNDRE